MLPLLRTKAAVNLDRTEHECISSIQKRPDALPFVGKIALCPDAIGYNSWLSIDELSKMKAVRQSSQKTILTGILKLYILW